MDLLLANTIVFRCVRKVGRVPSITASDELRQAGVASPDHLHSLINVICNDEFSGLPHENYSLDPNCLRDITLATQIGTVSQIVAQNAAPDEERP
ncbi:MAG TPA: hypothetical protein VLJ11_11825 [Bryobacteraceae bacterium]|nr:hypothetical protein [Bryobacteraceae bacterium]